MSEKSLLENKTATEQSGRYYLLDSLRGFSVISMILFHTVWDLTRIFGLDIGWYDTLFGEIWKFSISGVFITLSGFCVSLGRHRLRSGIKVFLSGVLVTLATVLVMPSARVLFGVLTLLGSCILISILAESLLKKLNPYLGIGLAFFLFFGTKDLLSRRFFFVIKVPETIYLNYFTAYIGLPPQGFYSSDYFPLLPWIFLFFAGYFLYRIFKRRSLLTYLKKPRILPLEWVGRHALILYLLHQPIIYFVLSNIFKNRA